MTTTLRCALILLTVLVFNSAGAWAGGTEALEVVPLADQPQELVRHVVWASDDPEVPLFVPAPVLQEEGSRALSSDPAVRERFEVSLEAFRQRQSPPFCDLVTDHVLTEHSDPNGLSIPQLLSNRGFTALGRVMAMVPGWNRDRVMTMIYVEIEEILHCRAGYDMRTISSGDIVALPVGVGGFEVSGVRMCNETAKTMKLPTLGNRVVIGGEPEEGVPTFIGRHGNLFVVADDVVLPQPYSGTRWESISYESLKEQLGGAVVTCREES